MSDIEKINELETKIAFQEELLQKLDDALAGQQKQLLEMEHRIRLMMEQIQRIESAASDPDDEKPPHY